MSIIHWLRGVANLSDFIQMFHVIELLNYRSSSYRTPFQKSYLAQVHHHLASNQPDVDVASIGHFDILAFTAATQPVEM